MRHSGLSSEIPGGAVTEAVAGNRSYVSGLFNVEIITLHSLFPAKILYE